MPVVARGGLRCPPSLKLRRVSLHSLRERRLVGGRGIEPLTPSMSRKCSSAELTARITLAEHDLIGKPVTTLGSSLRAGFFPIMLSRHGFSCGPPAGSSPRARAFMRLRQNLNVR